MSSLSEICADPVRTPSKRAKPLTTKSLTDAEVDLFNRVESFIHDGYAIEKAVQKAGVRLADYLALRQHLICSAKEAFGDYSKLELFRDTDLKKSGRHRNPVTGAKSGSRYPKRKPA